MPTEQIESTRKNQRVGVNLLVKLQATGVDEFIEHYATNISRGGIFIQCRDPHPPGSVLYFEIRLKGGKAVIRGKGEVMWSRTRDEAGEKPMLPGMGLKFLALDKPSKAVVNRILDLKAGEPVGAAGEVDEMPEEIVSPEPTPSATDDAPAPDWGEFSEDISTNDFVEPAQPQPALAPSEEEDHGSVHTIGIDLGTTNSCVAVVIDGKPRVLESTKGHRTIPSVVAWTGDGRQLVGHPAKDQVALNPEDSLVGSKRLLGRHYDSPAVQQMKARYPYAIVEGPDHEAAVLLGGKRLRLQVVASVILSELRRVASRALGEEVDRAVISVPAYYGENQRRAVREAGALAGLDVVRIVSEPTAAALAYGFERGMDKRVAVYDLGGGTFDATVIELCQNVYEVLAVTGDAFLGGVDFDNQLTDYVLEGFRREVGGEIKVDQAALQRLRDAVEWAKCDLSERTSATIHLPFFAEVDGVHKDLIVDVTRSALEILSAPLVERTMEVMARALDQARLMPEQVDDVLLVGGQSRMPAIRRRVGQAFGKEPFVGAHPDEAVAVGAALLADSVGKIDSVVLIDILSAAIGYGAQGGAFARIMEAGAALPASRTVSVPTDADNQERLVLPIFQGEHDRVINNEYLGTVTVTGITPAAAGTIQLELTFTLDEEGLLKASSHETHTDRINAVTLDAKHGEAGLRGLLQIEKSEVVTERFGVPVSIRSESRAPADELPPLTWGSGDD